MKAAVTRCTVWVKTYVRLLTVPQLYVYWEVKFIFIWFHTCIEILRLVIYSTQAASWGVGVHYNDQSPFNSYQIVSHCVQEELAFTECCLLSTAYYICLVCYLYQIYGLTETFYRFSLWINQPLRTWQVNDDTLIKAFLSSPIQIRNTQWNKVIVITTTVQFVSMARCGTN